MNLRTVRALASLALLAPTTAFAQGFAAQGFSTDIELVRPRFSPRSTFGTDSPFIEGEGALDFGVQVQYQNQPLRLIEFDSVTGAVVKHRAVTQLGVAWAPSDRVSLRAQMPLALHWDSETPDIAGDGLGVGDPTLGLRYLFYETNGFSLGAHGDLTLSAGSRNRYMGEARPRTAFGLLAAYEQGPVLLLSNLGLQTRSTLDTKLDFQLGNEAAWNVAGVLWLPTETEERLAVQAEILTRVGIRFSGAAESSMEWTAGFQYRINDALLLDAGLGRGITSGYGTSNYRVLAGLRYQIRPEPTPEERGFVVEVLDIPEDEPDDEPPEKDPETPPPDGWREGELARQVEDRIEIRDPIQFEYGTAKILPESLPTLRQVTGLVNRDARIAHLLIEGHASEEGTYAYNYDLSTRRAKAVFEQLFALGVHPERMSYRGMGEVVPLSDRTDEASLAANRRVEFEVVRQIQSGDNAPALRPGLKFPWSGEPSNPVIPPPLPVEAPPKKPDQDLLRPGTNPGSAPPTPAVPAPAGAANPTNPPSQPAGTQEKP